MSQKFYAKDRVATDSDLVWLAKMIVPTSQLRKCREGDTAAMLSRITSSMHGGCGWDNATDEHYEFRVEGRFVKWERGPRHGRTALVELAKLAGRYGNDELCESLREVDRLWYEAHDRPMEWSHRPPKPDDPEWPEVQRKNELVSEAYRRWRHLQDAWWALQPEGQGNLF